MPLCFQLSLLAPRCMPLSSWCTWVAPLLHAPFNPADTLLLRAPTACLPQDAIDRGYLRQQPKPSSPINIRTYALTMLDVALAVEQLHQQGILHGDLTSFNIMLSSAEPCGADARGVIAQVMDFG